MLGEFTSRILILFYLTSLAAMGFVMMEHTDYFFSVLSLLVVLSTC